MAKKNSNVVARRAWKILRMALLWARKGGVFSLRVVPKFMKSLANNATPPKQINYYFERELSFDKTPIIQLKMKCSAASSMLFHIPCFSPQVDFDVDDDEDLYNNNDFNAPLTKSFLKSRDHGEEEDEPCGICEEKKSIDDKAEEFIANFYEQMKLQRQISYLQYN